MWEQFLFSNGDEMFEIMPSINLLMRIEMTFYLQRRNNVANFKDILKKTTKFSTEIPFCVLSIEKHALFSVYCDIGIDGRARFHSYIQQLLRHTQYKIVRFVCFNDCILQKGAIYTMEPFVYSPM